MKKTIESVYLDHLEYDPALDHSPFRFFLDRPKFLLLVIVVIAIAGLISVRSLPLESNPEVQIGIAIVSTVLPGASPEVMEDMVTKKLEQQIAKIKGIDTLKSTSQNSVSLITIQFLSNANMTTAMTDLRNAVDIAQPNFPADTKDSVVKEISFSDTPVWTFSIAGKYNGFELYRYAKLIKDELEKNPLVSEADISGGDQTEFTVFIDPKKLEQYGLTTDAVNAAIRAFNIAFPIGDYTVQGYTHVFNVDERYYTIGDLKGIPVSKIGDTGVIHIDDLGRVEETAKKHTSLSRLSASGGELHSSVSIGVVKRSGGSIVNLVSDGQAAIAHLRETGIIPADITIVTNVDLAERIRLDLHGLIRDGSLTILIVFSILFLVIGVKEALVAGISAPLVFLVTFVIMSAFGQTLNFLSMFALILALGLLVDDAIVVISAFNQYHRTGKFTAHETALLVLRDYKVVLTSTTLTVVWIFSAMLFMTGIIGKFIFSIPFVITVTLITSLIIALTINPGLAVFFESIGENKLRRPSRWSRYLNQGFIDMGRLENLYGRIITYFVSHRGRSWVLIGCITLLFLSSLALPVMGILKSDFFPKTDQDIIVVNVETEPGTTLDETSSRIHTIEERLRQEKEITNFLTTVGSTTDLGNSGGASSGGHYASILINLVKKEYGRKESSMSIADRLRTEFDTVHDLNVTVIEQGGGPPAGGDFELRIIGDDFATLDRLASEVKKIVSAIPGAINVSSSRKPLPTEFRLTFDPQKLALYGITLPQVSLFIQNIITGNEATKIYKDDDEIIVRTRYESGAIDTLDKIKDVRITNMKGQAIPLRDIMSNTLAPSVYSISHEDQKRLVVVSASADKSTTGPQILATFNEKTEHMKLPVGYEFSTGGANEENAKSVTSLLVALGFGLFFIIGTLVILFDSYIQSVLVLITIPLSLIGVFYGLTLTGQPLSFPGLIGLVALFGIVVRNGIILFDKINLNLKERIPFRESIIDAGKSRLEPVVLTSLCTMLGMIPLTLSNPTWTSLGLSIIFGLATSTFFTLLVLPTLFFLLVRDMNKPVRERIMKTSPLPSWKTL